MTEEKVDKKEEQQEEAKNTNKDTQSTEVADKGSKTFTAEDIANMTEEEIDELKYGSKPKEESPKEEEKTPQELKEESEREKGKVLNKIIQGVNDVWEEDYDFKELGLKFHIKVRLPNIKEQSRIRSLADDLLDNDAENTPDVIYYQYFMLATLLTVGIDVPKEFRDPNKIYTLSPLMDVYLDYVQYANSFRY